MKKKLLKTKATKKHIIVNSEKLPGALPEIRNGGLFWGPGGSPQAREAIKGLESKPTAAGGWGFGDKAPSRQSHGGLGAKPPALENIAFFFKNNVI